MNNIQTQYLINYFLFNTNSIFHNEGLSIYTIKTKFIDKHSLNFIREDFENIKLTTIEEILGQLPDELQEFYLSLQQKAFDIISRLCISVARQGVLFSHNNLLCDMKPHVHRHVYSDNILPSITIHFRLFGNDTANFNYYRNVTQEEALTKDLCRRDTILKWCANEEIKTLELKNSTNIILFNSALTPHYVEHHDALNVYFVFDNVILKKPLNEDEYSVPIILHE